MAAAEGRKPVPAALKLLNGRGRGRDSGGSVFCACPTRSAVGRGDPASSAPTRSTARPSQVVEAVVDVNGAMIFGTPKSHQSRSVPMPRSFETVLLCNLPEGSR